MSELAEFLEETSRQRSGCSVSKLLVFLDDADPDRAATLREAMDTPAVTGAAIARVVEGWQIEGAPQVHPQTYQRHRNGVCCRGY